MCTGRGKNKELVLEISMLSVAVFPCGFSVFFIHLEATHTHTAGGTSNRLMNLGNCVAGWTGRFVFFLQPLRRFFYRHNFSQQRILFSYENKFCFPSVIFRLISTFHTSQTIHSKVMCKYIHECNWHRIHLFYPFPRLSEV